MRNMKVGLLVVGLLLLMTASPALALVLPPPESAWIENRMEREDPRPFELGLLTQRPVTDGVIDPLEWAGATTYEVFRPSTQEFLGTLYAGWYNQTVFLANDWSVNIDPDPAQGAANAWRIGTSSAQGPEHSGDFRWYEIYVDGTGGGGGGGMARWAESENELQDGTWQVSSFFDVFTELSFNGDNWQYELEINRDPLVEAPDDPNSVVLAPDPGRPSEGLPICFHWEWRQIDPEPWDWGWVPVYDGTMHAPEPSTVISLLGMAVMGLLYVWRRRS